MAWAPKFHGVHALIGVDCVCFQSLSSIIHGSIQEPTASALVVRTIRYEYRVFIDTSAMISNTICELHALDVDNNSLIASASLYVLVHVSSNTGR